METLGEEQKRSPQGKRLRKEMLLKDKDLQDRKEAPEHMVKQREADRAHLLAVIQAVSKSTVELIGHSKKD